MNKEEISNKYQELLKEYQDAEVSRRKNIEEVQKIKEQKDIAEQKVEFEEAKERFEPDSNLSTEEIIKRAKQRQEMLDSIEKTKVEAEQRCKEMESKKEKIRKSAREYYEKTTDSVESELKRLEGLKKEQENKIEQKRAKIEQWAHKENRTTEEYIKIGNELKAAIEDLNNIELDIKKEEERLSKNYRKEIVGMEVLYKNFINGANRIDAGKFYQNVDSKNTEAETKTKRIKNVNTGASKKQDNKELKDKGQEDSQTTKKEEANKKQDNFKENDIEDESKNPIKKEQKNPQTTKKEETNKKQNDFKEIDNNAKDKDPIKVLYSAKFNKYLVTNTRTKETTIFVRRSTARVNLDIIKEQYGNKEDDLTNVDINLLAALEKYNSKKAAEYYKLATTRGKSKEERKGEFEDKQISIKYNLKGLYDQVNEIEDKFTQEQREEILNIANNAKRKGIATVNKGLKVRIGEIIDKISKILEFKDTKKLSEGNVEQTKNEDIERESKQESELEQENKKSKSKSIFNKIIDYYTKVEEETENKLENEEKNTSTNQKQKFYTALRKDVPKVKKYTINKVSKQKEQEKDIEK